MSKSALGKLAWACFILGTVATGIGAALPVAVAVKITMGAGGAFLAIAADARRRMNGAS